MAIVTVRELISELIKMELDEPVFIGLGAISVPTGYSMIYKVSDHTKGSCVGGAFGVYLIPREHLEIPYVE